MAGTFAGRAALVTGASRGIGRAIAKGWVEQGGDVALAARDRASLDELASELSAHPVHVETLPVDLSRDQELLKVPERIRARFGRLDVLVHAAGVYADGPASLEGLEAADTIWRVNARAPLALSLGCLEMLREAGGEIVFVNSSVATNHAAAEIAYAASKRALAGVADGLRARFNADGVRVTSIYPGRTATPMQREISASMGRPYRPERLLQAEDVASVVLHALSLPRTAEITDVHIRPFQKPD